MEQENFDFYQEALKAFDAPVPQPKKEEPEQETAAEVPEPAAPEKPKRKRNPWWAVALCAILCLALVIGFGRAQQDDEPTGRGAHYLYGRLKEVTDEYIVVERKLTNWFVELDERTGPVDVPVGTGIWVFYNGEPEETERRGCTQKITATFWKTDEAPNSVRDEIVFDLDGNGDPENWTLITDKTQADEYYNRPPTIYLTATDSQGNTLHSISFKAPAETDSVVFSDAGGKLVVMVSRFSFYETLGLQLLFGDLNIDLDGVPLEVVYHYDATPSTQPPESDPPETQTTEPTAGETKHYTIQFVLGKGVTDTEEVLSSMRKKLTDQVGDDLVQRLDALQWESAEDANFQGAGYFTLASDEMKYEDSYYVFSQDGRLQHKGMVAAMDPALFSSLAGMMDRGQISAQEYFAFPENGHILSIRFLEDGKIQISDFASIHDAPRIYEGFYGAFGEYFYLVFGENLNYSMVLKMGTAALKCVARMSAQEVLPLDNKIMFHPDGRGGMISLTLWHTNGTTTMATEKSILSVWEIWTLRQMLEQREWEFLPDSQFDEAQVLCRFTLFDGTGADVSNGVSYYLLAGGRLYRIGDKMVSRIGPEDQTLWSELTRVLRLQSEAMMESYSGVNQDGMSIHLELSSNGGCQYTVQLKNKNGTTAMYTSGCSYLRLGRSIVLLEWYNDGPAYVHLDMKGEQLVYDAERSTANLAFSQTTQATLTQLYAVPVG